MFRVVLSLAVTTIPAIAYAHNQGCATPGASMESVLFSRLSTDLKIDTSTIDETQAKVEVLDISPISRIYAEHLARTDYDNDPDKGKTEDKYNKIYFSSYYDDDVKSITAKYTYTNKSGNKAVFIATSLMNKNECSVRFNGYITLSREF